MRLRQVVLAAHDLEATAARIQAALDLPDPFPDPGVAEFGLRNAVFEVGDTFIEVVSPTADNTAAGRYLAKQGDPEAAGYMVIFQTDDLAAARHRAKDNRARIVWQADLPDIAGTHLHPADMPGAIVSIDWADPVESWHWAGPRWRGGAPSDRSRDKAVDHITIATPDPDATSSRWHDVLGQPAPGVRWQQAHGAVGIVEIAVRAPAATTTRLPLALGTVRLMAQP